MDVLPKAAMPPPPVREDHVHSGWDLDTEGTFLAGPNHLVVSLLNEGRAPMGREVVKQLLLAFVHPLWATEPFEVGKADVGDVAVRGFGNACEEVNLLLVVGAHLDHHKFGLRRGVEQRQWHANVVVQVAQGGGTLCRMASTSRMSSLVVVLPLLPVMASTGHVQRLR